MNRYIVMESTAQVRGKMREYGRYRRVAVVETVDGTRPKMISPRALGMVRIVQEWSPVLMGKTERSSYAIAMAAAEKLAGELNAQKGGEI